MREGGGLYKGVITLLQEIAGSARQILGQATHVYRFRLEDTYDASKLNRRFARAREAGRITGNEPKRFHGFWHSRVDMLDMAREYSSWHSFI